MKYFLASTAHLERSLLFKDNEDFIAAMNFVAIVAFLSGVTVLSFVLMSNHVHFVLICSSEKAEKFINRFKKFYSAYYQRKYGGKEFLRRLKFDIRPLRLEDESLQKGIAYVIVNPVAANLCLNPAMYPWGTGDTFFNLNPKTGRQLSCFTRNKQRKLLHSKVSLPQSYCVSEEGYILPSSFIPVRQVESLFRTPKGLNHFINNSSKAKIRLEKLAAPTFSDQLILSACNDLIRSLFRAQCINDLDNYQKGLLLDQLRRRFSADIGQVCRVTGISYSDAAMMIDNL